MCWPPIPADSVKDFLETCFTFAVASSGRGMSIRRALPASCRGRRLIERLLEADKQVGLGTPMRQPELV